MEEIVLIKKIEGNVVTLRLNRPEQANALNSELFTRLREELDALQWDDQVRVVIIAGSGEKAFCAGIDLKERAQKEKDEILRERETIIRPFYVALGNFPKPTIAAMNGAALGGGAELALTCDIRVATPAARFGQSEIKWGMIPSCGACQRLRLITGMGAAKEIILTGRVLEADEAYRLGIYNRLVSYEKLEEETMSLAKQISENPPIAVKQAKKALDSGADISAALDFDFEASKECFFAGDALSKPKTF
ncbi:MAG TPA: enoyl-CoA hydratase/isomerase family protein [Syntrophales bacterium]|nr:enoyl-CoA hydratase/isomerase family protein [Syntrophales bacterium]HLE17771.1 enoyl-CoA hydratase/isomerase family protein [Syntrophales bacterium]